MSRTDRFPSRRAVLGAAALTPFAAPARAQKVALATTAISRADLKWWRERHEAKVAELRTRQPALVFYGDSITQQYEYDGPPDWKAFAPVWDRFYGRRNAVNLGFNGDTTASLIWRVRNGQASDISPRAAVVLIGANNLGRVHWPAADTVAGIETILGELKRRLPATRVLLLGVLPSDRNEWATATTGEINRALAAKYPAGHTVSYLDAGRVFLRNGRLDRDLFYDPLLSPPAAPLHPTARGMALLAEAIEPTLARLLA